MAYGLGDGETPAEEPDKDPFDEIVSGQDGEESPELETVWQAVTHIWPHFYEGFITKGILVVEYMDPDGEKLLRILHSPDLNPWDAMGLLRSATLDAEAADRMSLILEQADDEDEDE